MTKEARIASLATGPIVIAAAVQAARLITDRIDEDDV